MVHLMVPASFSIVPSASAASAALTTTCCTRHTLLSTLKRRFEAWDRQCLHSRRQPTVPLHGAEGKHQIVSHIQLPRGLPLPNLRKHI